MLFHPFILLRAAAFTLILSALYLYSGGNSWAQSNLGLVKTNAPEQYVDSVLIDIKTDGMSSIRSRFQEMGFLNPQNETMIALFESMEADSEARWTKNMGYARNKEVMEQHYAYAYLGNNAFLFIRIDFFRTGEHEWAVANFSFNSDYRQMIAPNFDFLD
jgi:hypothetical protein